jgi:hypothetical protein
MGLFKSNQPGETRRPIRVENAVAPFEFEVTADKARMALAVAIIDETLKGDRSTASRLENALLEVRHALAPGRKPLDAPLPVIPGRSS